MTSDGAGEAVAQKILKFHRTGPEGEVLALADVTDFEWTAVHVFPEGTEHKLVNDTVGATVFDGGGRLSQRGTFLVFTYEGEVQVSTWVVPVEIGASKLTYGPRAMLTTTTPAPGPYGLRFEDR